jgi:hypothetical protein
MRFARSSTVRFCLLTGLLVTAVSACSGGAVSLSPSPHASGTHSNVPTPSPSPVATASAVPAQGATLSPAAVATALNSAQTLYQSLPHTSVASDLQMLATQMVKSGKFTKAAANPGAVTGILPDGTSAILFADRFEDLAPSTASASAARAARAARRNLARQRADLPLSPANSHEIAFLINEQDTNAFTPSRQLAFANAFTARGFTPAAGYGVDYLDITLDNIAALASDKIDLLDIDTHSGVLGLGPLYYYMWDSDTPVNAENNTKYAAALAAGTVAYSALLVDKGVTVESAPFNAYAFSIAYLTSKLSFNPGALVDNQGCFGFSPQISDSVQTDLGAAGVGRYLAWDKAVGSDDSDGTEGFIFDRLLGEQTPATGLAPYANQNSIPQQPFALDDVFGAMKTEMRNSPFQQPGPGYQYTFSVDPDNAPYPPTSNGPAASLYIVRYDTGSDDPPVEYGMPSITNLAVAESPSQPTMTITGEFPPTQGSVTITDTAGAHALAVTSWSTTSIKVSLPGSGPGSAGDVAVLGDTMIGGNTVPLTQWTATLTGTENDTFTQRAGASGSGSGSLAVNVNAVFRSDVHPVVPSIDASPVPQNLTFSNVEANSTANMTAYSGTFTSSSNYMSTDHPLDITYSLSQGAPTMTMSLLPLVAPGVAMGTVAGQPSPCNDGNSGQGTAGSPNIFCPGIGYASLGVSQCSDDQSGAGCAGNNDPTGAFSDGSSTDGLLVLTMDPSSYGDHHNVARLVGHGQSKFRRGRWEKQYER